MGADWLRKPTGLAWSSLVEVNMIVMDEKELTFEGTLVGAWVNTSDAL